MRGRYTFVLVLLVSLVATQAASAAVKDFGALVTVAPLGNGQFVAMIQNSDTTAPLTSFTFEPGPGLTVTSVVGSDSGYCVMTGPTFTCTGLNLGPAECACVLGGIVNVTFTGSGAPGGTIVPGRHRGRGAGSGGDGERVEHELDRTGRRHGCEALDHEVHEDKRPGGGQGDPHGQELHRCDRGQVRRCEGDLRHLLGDEDRRDGACEGEDRQISVTTKGGTATSAKSFLIA